MISFPRILEYYERNKIPHVVWNDVLFKVYGKMLVPLHPVKLPIELSNQNARMLLKKTNAWLIQYHSGWNTDQSIRSEWYSYVCDQFTDASHLKSKLRNEFNKGFENCRATRVEANKIAEEGYNVYRSSLLSYGQEEKGIMQHESFRRHISNAEEYEDIIDYWAVYRADKMVGYSSVYKFDKIEVNYSTIKFVREEMMYHPSHVLIYEMNKHYLQEQQFGYVNDGFRSLLHATQFQSFLEKYFRFRKAYSQLSVIFQPWLRASLTLLRPFSKIISASGGKANALFALNEIRLNSRKVQGGNV